MSGHADTIRCAIFHSRWYVRGTDKHPANCKGCAADTSLRALVAELVKQADRIAWLEGEVAGWRIKNQQLRDALERLGSNACFTSPFSYDVHTSVGAELKARTDFARDAAALDGTPSEDA